MPSPSPVFLAAASGNTAVLELLLTRDDAKVDYFTEVGITPLMIVAEKGFEPAARLLLDRGADVNMRAPESMHRSSRNALEQASRFGSFEVAKLLLKRGAKADARGGFWGNSLQAASYGGHISIMLLLLEHGAEVNLSGGSCGSPLDAAIVGCHEEAVILLLERGAGCAHLLDELARHRLKAVILWLAQHSDDLEPLDSHGWTIYDLASLYGDEAFTKSLPSKRRTPNSMAGGPFQAK